MQMYQGLTKSAMEGDVTEVRRLLAEGVPVDVIDNGRFNATPLQVAAAEGHYEVVQILLEAGANVNHVDNDGFSPVTAAGRAGKWPVVRLLAQHGGDFFQKDGHGNNGHFYLKRCRGKRTRAAIQAAFESRGKLGRAAGEEAPPEPAAAEEGDEERASLPLAPGVD